MRSAGVLILAGIGLLLLSARRASAAPVYEGQAAIDQSAVDQELSETLYPAAPEWVGLDATGDGPPEWADEPGATDFTSAAYEGGFVPISSVDPASLDALLFTIRTAEVGPAPDSDRYFIGYGFRRFAGTSEHPVVTGELQRVKLPDRMCRDAGLNPPCYSTAAGAYQFRVATWQEMRAAGPWGPRLPDFSPASQDEAARRLLMRTGSIERLARGDIEGAILRAGKHWASLPGSTANQRPKTMAQALAFYQAGLRQAGGSGVIV